MNELAKLIKATLIKGYEFNRKIPKINREAEQPRYRLSQPDYACTMLNQHVQSLVSDWQLDKPVVALMIDDLQEEAVKKRLLFEEGYLVRIATPTAGIVQTEDYREPIPDERGRTDQVVLLRNGYALPPCALAITVLRTNNNPQFRDIVACGLIDLEAEEAIWLSWLENSQYRTTFNGGDARQMRRTDQSVNPMLITGKCHVKQGRFKAAGLINFGHLMEMAHVSSGKGYGYLTPFLRLRDAGLAYALVKGADGYVSDIRGQPLDHLLFTPRGDTSLILACTQQVGQNVVALSTDMR